jgi:hypothetical protein
MFWIIQENLAGETGFDRLIQAVNRRSLPFQVVKVIPFSHALVPEPRIPAGPVIVSGSTALSNVAVERGWKPGAFLNQNFDFAIWKEKYKSLLLNEDATIEEFGELAPAQPVFIRPCSDDKAFAGFVIEPDEFRRWQSQVRDVDDPNATLTPKTMVLAAAPKPILREFRFFIVDGQVITGSLYREAGHRHYSGQCDDAAWACALSAAASWQPDTAFVIDIAMTDDGPKVIEINCMNSAGFYEADLDLLVEALERYFG